MGPWHEGYDRALIASKGHGPFATRAQGEGQDWWRWADCDGWLSRGYESIEDCRAAIKHVGMMRAGRTGERERLQILRWREVLPDAP